MEARVWITPPAPVLEETPVLLMTRAEGTWLVLLPLNRLLASTPFRRKLFEVSRWPLAQMGALPRPGICAGSAGQLGADAGGLHREAGKAAGGQRDGIDLRLIHHVAVGGVHGIHQRRGFHFDGLAGWPTFSGAFTVAVRFACTVMCGVFCTSKPLAAYVRV